MSGLGVHLALCALCAGPAFAAQTDCAYRQETEAIATVRVTVCLDGESLDQMVIVREVSFRIRNIGGKAIQLRAYSKPVELFRPIVSGKEGQIMKGIENFPVDSPESNIPIEWRYATLQPGESFFAATTIAELLRKPAEPDHLYRVMIGPGFSFETLEGGDTFHGNFLRMLNDSTFKRPVLFKDVRLAPP